MPIRILAAAISAFIAFAGTASGQPLDELVAKHIKSKGGLERLKMIKAVRVTGRISPAPTIEIPILIVSERPNKVRQESTFQGQTMITAFDGQKAWTVNPVMGINTATPLEGAELDAIRDQADVDGPFVDSKAKGITLELAGTEAIDGQQTHKVKVTHKSGRSQWLFLSADTGLEVKSVSEVEQAGMKLTIESFFLDYKPIDGVAFAHKITQKISGPQNAQLTITVDKVEMVPDVDDQLFAMPAKP
jgi:hypothetical protein